MSLADLLLSDVDDVFLNTDDHARTIAIIPPRGVDAVSVVGIWDISTEEMVEMNRGKDVVYKATFCYSADVTILTESTATVDGLAWVCTSPGASHAGLKTSHWKTTQPLHRANGSGNR